MNKTFIIIKREYLHAIRKKSFVIMTILGPILMACIAFIPAVLMAYDNETTTIAVLDESTFFPKLNTPADKEITFVYPQADLPTLKKQLEQKKYGAVLYIPYNQFAFGGMVYSTSSLKTGVMSNILAAMKRNLSDELLITEFNISQDSLDRYVKQHTDKVSLGYTYIDENGIEQTKSSHIRELQRFIGLAVGFMIYMFVFMYCSMVLRGVLEEKTNRIVEVIISSVKPIQLMVGKIVGVALIALTQVGIWVLLLGVISLVLPLFFSDIATTAVAADPNISMPSQELFAVLGDINIPQLLVLFLFYFMAGYFLYASLYAAVGSAVDNDTDSQQLVLPITMPLILSLVLLTYVVNHPDGQIAFWFSMIPLTSPIVMMVRLPGAESVPMWEVLLSCGILLLTCITAAYAAAKVYKTGILMYGKKNTYKELWKWIRYKN